MRRLLIASAVLAAALAACELPPPTPTPDPAVSQKTAAVTASPTSAGRATSQIINEPSANPTAPAPTAAASSIPAPPDVAAPPADAQKTASGLVTKVIKPGTGKDHPLAKSKVKAHYTGWTKDGKMFDSSRTRGEPLEIKASDVIKGWTEGLQLMVAGEQRRMWIPAALAYGEHPRMGAPSGDLVFDVELLSFTSPSKPPPTPADVKAPPADATKTASGLSYKRLKKGDGKDHPKETSTVTVNYTGWTTDGKQFDSSFEEGEPISFPLNRVIKGWTEGLQLMVVGDTMRFWIPGPLAYGDKPTRPGAPAGTLVFDVELLSIK